jgi:hypothetical protein
VQTLPFAVLVFPNPPIKVTAIVVMVGVPKDTMEFPICSCEALQKRVVGPKLILCPRHVGSMGVRTIGGKVVTLTVDDIPWGWGYCHCWRHGMARMAIHVSGQRQKHGSLLVDEMAKWLLQFSGDPRHPTHPCAPHDTLLRQNSLLLLQPSPPPSLSVPSAVAVAAIVLVLLPPPPSRLLLPLLVDSCVLSVSTAVAVAAIAATAIVVVAAPAAVTVAVVVATITIAAAGNAMGGGGDAELMG